MSYFTKQNIYNSRSIQNSFGWTDSLYKQRERVRTVANVPPFYEEEKTQSVIPVFLAGGDLELKNGIYVLKSVENIISGQDVDVSINGQSVTVLAGKSKLVVVDHNKIGEGGDITWLN